MGTQRARAFVRVISDVSGNKTHTCTGRTDRTVAQDAYGRRGGGRLRKKDKEEEWTCYAHMYICTIYNAVGSSITMHICKGMFVT